jgi:hypothetical protein
LLCKIISPYRHILYSISWIWESLCKTFYPSYAWLNLFSFELMQALECGFCIDVFFISLLTFDLLFRLRLTVNVHWTQKMKVFWYFTANILICVDEHIHLINWFSLNWLNNIACWFKLSKEYFFFHFTKLLSFIRGLHGHHLRIWCEISLPSNLKICLMVKSCQCNFLKKTNEE